jgi:ribosome-binding ATPase YchF (GTP1/OBG family)
MDFFARHPYLYQIWHPWHWFTYGQNASRFGTVFTTLLNLATIYVLYKTLLAVNKQSDAADRQAKAAEEQVAAAKSSAAVSDAQRIATEQSALAEREHSALIRHQILSGLRPIIVVGKEPHPTAGGKLAVFRNEPWRRHCFGYSV